MNKITIYWAASCFTQAERIWNRLCARYLRKKGHLVILPQDEAKLFPDDPEKMAINCYTQSISSDIVVAILDGPDPDSGMSMEVGFKIRDREFRNRGRVLGVRTDFRVSEDEHLNLMFRLVDQRIYFPSFNESYEKLCDKIDEAIKGILDI